jgi:hypothetical protein
MKTTKSRIPAAGNGRGEPEALYASGYKFIIAGWGREGLRDETAEAKPDMDSANRDEGRATCASL